MVLGVLAPRSAIWKLPRNGLGEVWKDHLLQPYCNGHVQFAMLRNAIGYLRVTTFYDYTEGGYANQLHGLQKSLETMYGERVYQALGSLL